MYFLVKLLARSIRLSRPFLQKPRIRIAVASKSGVAGNSEFNKSWKPPGWGGSIVIGSSRDSRWLPHVGADSNSSPIPDITVCSSTACRNSGGNFVAIVAIVTIWMGSLAMTFASGVTRRPVARKTTIPSTSPTSRDSERRFDVPLSGAGGGGGR